MPSAITGGDRRVSGDGPAQELDWAVNALCKVGQMAIFGVYPPDDRIFSVGKVITKNLTVRMSNCNRRRYCAH